MDTGGIVVLSNQHQEELLTFLGQRPIHTVCMSSFVRDNGVVSPLNRGTFYAYRGTTGKIEGAALLGHATLVESENEEALRNFAELTHKQTPFHLIRGEHKMIDQFWSYYAELGHDARLTCREILFENQTVTPLTGVQPDLKPATIEELDKIAQINAEMILDECGVDPLIRDPAGFRARLARRINQHRIWIWKQNDRVIFKADIFAETPEMIYLEGVYVDPNQRRRGIGQRSLTHLSNLLLRRSKSLCLLINEEHGKLQEFYRGVGFQSRGTYETLYFTSKNV
jgi:predicted GNAT family acetyltransferase